MLSLKSSVHILPVINVVFFISLPANAKRFSILFPPWRFIEYFHVVPVWSWFFLCVSQYNFWYGTLFALAKCAWFRCSCCRNLWFDDVGIFNFIVFESTIFRKRIFMRSVPPSRCGLIPSWHYLLERYICVLKNNRSVGSVFVEKIRCMRLIAAHVLCWKHTSILLLIGLCAWLILHLFSINKIKIILVTWLKY